MDIFKGVVWYSYQDEPMNWIPIPAIEAKKIIEINKKGGKVESLEEFKEDVELAKKVEFVRVVGQDDLDRFDVKKESSKKRNNKKRRRGLGPKDQNQQRGKRSNVGRGDRKPRENNDADGNKKSNQPRRITEGKKTKKLTEGGSRQKKSFEGDKANSGTNKPKGNKKRWFNKKSKNAKGGSDTKNEK
jgi:hypothetical protein